jgi:hypothetical protein
LGSASNSFAAKPCTAASGVATEKVEGFISHLAVFCEHRHYSGAMLASVTDRRYKITDSTASTIHDLTIHDSRFNVRP